MLSWTRKRFPSRRIPRSAPRCRPCLQELEDRLVLSPPGSGWQLTWSDEFNGTSLDTSKWRVYTGARRDAVNTAAAVSESGGYLTITTYTSGGTNYTGFIGTPVSFLGTYGYWEARINFEDSPGEWSAFWEESPTIGNPLGNPAVAGTEIDNVEHRYTDGTNNISNKAESNLHWDGYGSSEKSAGSGLENNPGSASLQGNFHLYALQWSPTGYQFYIDGTQVWSSTQGLSQRSEFIYLTSEVQNNSWAGNIPSGGYGSLATSTTKMIVDYVRVYERVPSDWSSTDVGSPGILGSAAFIPTSGTWTVAASGADIWGTADQFHFASQGFTGDGSVTARVNSLQNTDPWAKAGVMFRDSTDAGAPFADMLATAGNGVSFQWRTTAGGSPSSVTVSGLSAPVWVQLVRSGDAFSGYYSTDGVTWTQVGTTQAIAMSATARAGLAVTSHNANASTTAVFSHVSLLPGTWTAGDVGATGLPGSSVFNPATGVWTVTGSGSDIWGTSDQFQLASQSLVGDGTVRARVTSVQNTDVTAKAGVMFRDSLAANAPFADVVQTPGQGVKFEWRSSAGGQANLAAVAGVTAPVWVQLVRSGNTFSGYYSTDGVNWTQIGTTQTIAMGSTALTGLAVTAHNNSALCAATFTDVSLLPAGWGDADVGSPGKPGYADYDPSSGTWTVAGGGADIWGTADQFHLASQGFTGDGTLTAQVTSVLNTDPWAKAGVMFRDSADPGSLFADVVATPGNGVAFQWRTTAGATPSNVNVTGLSAPVWVQLVRAGNAFSAYYSTDGASWEQIGTTQTIAMGSTALAGLAVTAHNNNLLNAATFANVSLAGPVDLSGAFNQVGIVSDGTPFSGGGLDGNGDAYSANLLGGSVTAGGVTFNLGAADAANVVQAVGQTITLRTGQFSALSFLGTAVNGAQPGQTFVVTYTDGTSDTFTQDLSDWQNPQGYAGEAIAASMGYYNYADGSSPGVPTYLYQYSFTLNKQKTVSSITLPNNSNVMILALNLLA